MKRICVLGLGYIGLPTQFNRFQGKSGALSLLNPPMHPPIRSFFRGVMYLDFGQSAIAGFRQKRKMSRKSRKLSRKHRQNGSKVTFPADSSSAD